MGGIIGSQSAPLVAFDSNGNPVEVRQGVLIFKDSASRRLFETDRAIQEEILRQLGEGNVLTTTKGSERK